MHSVHKTDQGHAVYCGGRLVKDGFATSAEAWRYVDRLEDDPVSATEKRTAFLQDKFLKGE